ncbi:MAG: ATP-dependent helicase HrpB [Pseudomonadota bacterium]|jgi:ATP-dependent helicase HrpA
MSLLTLRDLEAQLASCLVRDRHPVQMTLRRLQRQSREGGAGQAELQKHIAALEQRIAESVAAFERRRRSVPVVEYPEALPVSARVADLKAAIARHQVVIIAGETGSGKTTQLPKICLELGRGVAGMIGHTQPRRLAARTVAARIADELGVKEGREVGFQVRFADSSGDDTLIKLMTDGILLAETQNDPYLNRYDTIIIDEAHERSLNIDFLLGYLKRLLPKRPDLKLLITSATIDLEKFSAHFDNAPIVEVSGRTYPVEILYRPRAEATEELELPEQVLAAFEEILQLERKHRPTHRDVLVFLSGEKEIREVADVMRKAQIPGLDILPLYARLSHNEQQRVFQSHAGRRIVLTTNVAETSLTVPGIGYVIDSGFARISRYSVRSKIQRLPIEPVSQASANQRAGRCGRLGPGVCIRLYSEEDYQTRPAFTDTEITRTNLASVILQMLALKLGDIDNFPFLEPPETRAVRDGFQLLQELQAVDLEGKLLPLGRDMARLPLDPRLARVLLEAAQRGSLTETLIIVSALSVQDPRERPHDRQQAADEAHRRYADPESDFLAYFNLWVHYEQQRDELGSAALRRDCQKNFLSWMRMREWREVHRQLLLLCHEMKLKLNREPSTFEAIHCALLSGFLSQVATRIEDGSYLGARSRKYVVFPGSALHRKNVRWLVSAELVETSQLFARMNAKVEPEWIEQQAAHLVRKEYFEPHWEQKQGKVLAYEKVLLYGLALVEKRRVAFGTVDPVESRAIFIRDGLVDGQIRTRAPFYQANRKLIAEIGDIEERTRRRDILVDERHIAAFYDSVLPEQVVDVASLERWYFGLPKADTRKLLLTENYLINAGAPAVDLSQFPEELNANGLELPLEYAFEPGEARDGVSVDVPVSVLKQLRSDELDWLVPGLWREKCIALVKALPKALRRNFVPVPDIIDKVLPQLQRKDGSLQQALARQLLRHTGVQLPPDCWDTAVLPEHLSMNIRVLDENGKLLGSGRDLQVLREQFAGTVQASISKAAQHSIEQKGLTAWTFGDLPLEQELGGGAVKIKAYPALVDKGDSVDLCLLDSEYRARLATSDGVVRLLMLASKQQVRYLQKELLQDPSRVPKLRPLAPREQLLEQLTKRAYYIAFNLQAGLPRSAAAFASQLEKGRSEVLSVANKLQDLFYRVVDQWFAVRKELERKVYAGSRELLLKEDVQRQLDALIAPDFLKKTPWEQLQQMPRYLQALALRLEKYPLQAARDQESARLLARLWTQYAERRAYCDRHEILDERLDEYRWLLEELRVSLFAQALGTRVPVSEKRLERAWQELLRK